MSARPILSKGEFRDLQLLRLEKPECFLGDPLGHHRGRVYDVINAYDAVIDELRDVRDERDAMRKDITAVVTCVPQSDKLPKLRLVLVGFLLPWVSVLFGKLVHLCRHVKEDAR